MQFGRKSRFFQCNSRQKAKRQTVKAFDFVNYAPFSSLNSEPLMLTKIVYNEIVASSAMPTSLVDKLPRRSHFAS